MIPPLPDPVYNDKHRAYEPTYSEAQLLTYRKEVVEMCAKTCEQWFHQRGLRGYLVADELRSLK